MAEGKSEWRVASNWWPDLNSKWGMGNEEEVTGSGPVDWGANVMGIVNVLDRSHNC